MELNFYIFDQIERENFLNIKTQIKTNNNNYNIIRDLKFYIF